MGLPTSMKYLTDVHAHPTDNEIPGVVMRNLPLGRVCAMASREGDQELVAKLASEWPDKVVPAFGYHPWFSFSISLSNPPPPKAEHYASLFLPDISLAEAQENADFVKLLPSLVDPVPLERIIESVRGNFERFPGAMLGEVGLDRAFRIPFLPFGTHTSDSSSSFSGPKLSPFHVPIEHQLAILEAQIALALEYKRNISLHSVKAQAATVDMLKRLVKNDSERFHAVSLDFHSASLSSEMWGDIQKAHSNVFLSLSTGINTSRSSSNYKALLSVCRPDRLLVESDYPLIQETSPRTWDMLQIVAQEKGWRVEETAEEVEQEQSTQLQSIDGGGPEGAGKGVGAVRRMMMNWELFERGDHTPIGKKVPRKERRRNRFPHAEEDWEDGDQDQELGTVVF